MGCVEKSVSKFRKVRKIIVIVLAVITIILITVLKESEFMRDKVLKIVDTKEQIYSYDQMSEDLKELQAKYPDHMKLHILTTTKDHRNIYEVVVGNQSAKKHIIIQASMHAREYMATLLVMKQLEYYLYYYDQESYEGVAYQDLFDQVAIHLVPMDNPDGVSISQFGLDGVQTESIKEDLKKWYQSDLAIGRADKSFDRYLQRFKANANGVDLNRNFDYGWEGLSEDYKEGTSMYKGTNPGSEPESECLIALTEKLSPVAAISYHATGSVIYWDYGQTGQLRDQCKSLVNQIHNLTGYTIRYASNDKQDAGGYGDWAVMVEHFPSATVEIGTGMAPLDISEFQSIWEKNRQMWAMLAYMYQ